MSNFREQILQKRQDEAANYNSIKALPQDSDTVNEMPTNFKFFGIQSVRSFPTTLELRLANGLSESLIYSLIIKFRFDPAEGITIKTTTDNVLITGRNLETLHQHLLLYRVQYIQTNIGNDLTDESDLFVKSIVIDEI